MAITYERKLLRSEKDPADKDKTIDTYQDLGWHVAFEGTWTKFFMGMDKPDFTVGQRVLITIEPDE